VGGAVRGALRPVTSAIAKPFTALATGVDDALRPLLAEGGSLGGLGTGFRTVAGGIDNAAATATNSVRTAVTNTRSAFSGLNWADDTGSIQIGTPATPTAPDIAAPAAGYQFAPRNVPTDILTPGEAWSPAQGTPVIGRIPDTAVVSGEVGYVRIEDTVKRWNLAKNDAWVQSIIDQQATVYVASPTQGNYWSSARQEPTVFAREVQQFLESGYKWQSEYLVPGT